MCTTLIIITRVIFSEFFSVLIIRQFTSNTCFSSRIRQRSYQAVATTSIKLVMLCANIDSIDSFHHCMRKYVPESARTNASMLLVGTKSDLRKYCPYNKRNSEFYNTNRHISETESKEESVPFDTVDLWTSSIASSMWQVVLSLLIPTIVVANRPHWRNSILHVCILGCYFILFCIIFLWVLDHFSFLTMPLNSLRRSPDLFTQNWKKHVICVFNRIF